jgi:5-bromo-4-chloroindolyl phosphate hydrolysis protein
MSQKIRRMQSLTAAIFQEVEAHPEKKSQIDRFMNYYLPTTLKLLDSYARIEEQGVTGENMAKAKADIERIADTLVSGYEKQLDTLYKAEAMDIAGDVSVIENMMKRDGLAGQNDFGQTMGGH